MSIRISITLITIFSLVHSALFASDKECFDIIFPYTIVCSKKMENTKIHFHFDIANIKFSICSKLREKDARAESNLTNLGLLVATGGYGLPLLLLTDFNSIEFDSDEVSVDNIKKNHIVTPVKVDVSIFFNGVYKGIYHSDQDGNLIINKWTGGVYELEIISDKYGILIEKNFFID